MANWIFLPPQFSSGLVLQQQAKTRLSGQTDPLLDLSLEMFRKPFDQRPVSPLDPNYGVIYTAALRTDKAGAFSFDLPPLKASFDPVEIRLSDGVRQHKIERVLIGEVFLLLGDDAQHPALLSLKDQYRSELLNLPYLRVFDLKAAASGNAWALADQADDLQTFSATGLMYGRELLIELRVPVGLITLLLPDCGVRDWLPGALKAHPSSVAVSKAKAGRLLHPLRQTSLRGMIWSGSPKDAYNANVKSKNWTSDLIKLSEQLRELFFPVEGKTAAFLMLQHPIGLFSQKSFYQQTLANEVLSYCAHHIPAPTAVIPVTGTTSSFTASPATLAQRLRTVSLGLLFQRKAPESAPECASIEQVGGKLMISFSNTGDGLRLTGDDTRVRGFAVCGADRIFKEAQAKVLYGVRVMVWHDDIPNPVAVTYAFSDNQTGNLISKDQLPVVPFRSDQTLSTYALPHEWSHCEDPADWQNFDGLISYQREKANKTEGEACLKLNYQHVHPQVAFGPLIDRRVDFPPLSLAGTRTLSLDVFNPDRVEKTIQLKILAIAAPGAREAATAVLKVPPALRWQTLSFDLEALGHDIDLAQIVRIKILLNDPNQRGLIYLDNIRWR